MRIGWRCGGILGVVFGAGCLIPNPDFASASRGSESQGTSTASTVGASPTTSATGTKSTGTSEVGGSSGGIVSGGGTSGTGASGGGSAAYCEEGIQVEQQCVLLGATPYLMCDTLSTWQQAADSCAAMCGRLAVVLTDEDRLAIHTAAHERMTPEEQALEQEVLMKGTGQFAQPLASLWIGGHDLDARVGGPFTWIDGTMSPALPGQEGWGTTDPDEAGGSCMVLAVWGKAADDGYWHDRKCTLNYRYVCDPG